MPLTSDKKVNLRTGSIVNRPVAAGVKIFSGALVMQVNGFATPAKPSATGSVLGISTEYVDNTGCADGDKKIDCETGIFLLAGSGITASDIGKTCYAVDDEKVDLTSTGRIAAGTIFDVTADGGVWVKINK